MAAKDRIIVCRGCGKTGTQLAPEDRHAGQGRRRHGFIRHGAALLACSRCQQLQPFEPVTSPALPDAPCQAQPFAGKCPPAGTAHEDPPDRR
jgi:hypothetical protein